MTFRAYMLCCYQEHGPEQIRFALTPEALHPPPEARPAFDRLIADPTTAPNVAHNLTSGWGGWQLIILETPNDD